MDNLQKDKGWTGERIAMGSLTSGVPGKIDLPKLFDERHVPYRVTSCMVRWLTKKPPQHPEHG